MCENTPRQIYIRLLQGWENNPVETLLEKLAFITQDVSATEEDT